jgi:hypothetical protein
MKKARIMIAALITAAALFAGCKALGGESELSDDEAQRVQDLLALYSVTFEVNGGQWADGSTGAVTVGQEPGAMVTLPEAGVPQREGYRFEGWYTDGNEGAARVGDLNLTTSLQSKLPPGAVAVSTDTVFTIDEEDEEVVLKPGTYEAAAEAGEEAVEKTAWSPKTVYAIWRKLEAGRFFVAFKDSKESTTTLAVAEVTEGQAVAPASVPSPDKPFYERDANGAWFRYDTDAEFDLNTVFDEATIQESGLEGLELYPKWKGATYTVTFDLNGASGKAPTPVNVQYPTKLTNAQIPTSVSWQYYEFKGWFLGQRPAGTQLTTSTVINGNKTFYAGWLPNAQADGIRQTLQQTYLDMNNTINTQAGASVDNMYKDDYVIGSGIYSGSDDPALLQNVNKLNGLLNEAGLLLQGTTQNVTVLTENGAGGLSEQSFQIVVYDYAKMKEVNDKILKFKQENPLFDYGRIQPKIANITQTGKVHSVTVATTGKYKIEAYGGGGGHIWSKNNKTALGGAAGYAKGVINLTAGTVLKVRVGGEGVGSSSATVNADGTVSFAKNSNGGQNGPFNGGYNGGGKGGKSINSGYTGGSGGGGASDVRLIGAYVDGTNNKQNGVGKLDTLDKRIIVAAGGGGAGQSADVGNGNWPGIPGGSGGQTGDPGMRKGEGSGGGVTNNAARGATAEALQPVTNIGGKAKLSGTQLGVGADGAPAGSGGAAEGTGGGGGGYYGGEAVQNSDGYHSTSFTASGAGGSNFVGTDFTGTENKKSSRYGVGSVVIEYLPEN